MPDSALDLIQLQLPHRRTSRDILQVIMCFLHSRSHWHIGYHSHLSTQYCDGLRGPIVIYDPEDPYKSEYDVDDETTVISLADHYHDTAPKLQANWFANGGPPPPPRSVLVNGVGQCNSTASGKDCTSAEDTKWSAVNVKAGSRYRLRFINMACEIGLRVSIQNHTMDIIESDSTVTQRQKVQYFDIFPAQRFSVILNADQAAGNYCTPLP
jgi:iron transport multicopper oxidase